MVRKSRLERIAKEAKSHITELQKKTLKKNKDTKSSLFLKYMISLH